MLVADHHSLEQLLVLADAISQKRSWKRLQAVILAKQGWTAAHIATSLSGSIRSVKNWVAQYNRGGIEALRARERRTARGDVRGKSLRALGCRHAATVMNASATAP